MKRTYFLLVGLLAAASALAQTTRVGVGTTTPRAGLDVQHNDGLIATGQGPTSGSIPGPGDPANLPTGAGTRLLWIPAKAAFRVGQATGSEWDYDNIGAQSVAMGYQTTASGVASAAMGLQTTASGSVSTALGHYTTASGEGAAAVGTRSTASGTGSVALGTYASTNGKAGSFALGDYSSYGVEGLLTSTVANEFSARFAGGYRLFTNSTMSVGVSLAGGGNAWQTISDSTKKTGFRAADGQAFLQKIARMRLGSWHYRGQDARTQRHYGPMAQDFFAAFGRDGVGTVGTDTTINQADFDGVNLIAIQALIAEVEALKAENQRLKTRNAALGRETLSLRADVDAIKRVLVPYTGK